MPGRTPPAIIGVEDSMVTWARTRGSMMKFFPVAAATASAICVMSASLKLGVMRWDWSAMASDPASSTASRPRAGDRNPVTRITPD